jgi:hypothetical protein
MLSNIAKFILPVALVIATATAARADTAIFPFTYTTTGSGAQITASGYFVTDGYSNIGNVLAPGDITSWNITFTSPSFLGASFVLYPSNSNLSIPEDYTSIYAVPDPNDLVFEAINFGGGFDLIGTDQFGQGQYQVEWRWLDGTTSSSIMVTSPEATILGADAIDNFPAFFDTAGNTGVGTSPAPTPEPSSLLLLGTGCLSIAAAGLRKLKVVASSNRSPDTAS